MQRHNSRVNNLKTRFKPEHCQGVPRWKEIFLAEAGFWINKIIMNSSALVTLLTHWGFEKEASGFFFSLNVEALFIS